MKDLVRELRKSLGIAGEAILKSKLEFVINPKKYTIRDLNFQHSTGQSNYLANFGKFDLVLTELKTDNTRAFMDIKTRTSSCWDYNSLGQTVFRYESLVIDAKKWKDVIETKNNVIIAWISPSGQGIYYFLKPASANKKWFLQCKISKRKDTRRRKPVETIHFDVNLFPIQYGWENFYQSIKEIL